MMRRIPGSLGFSCFLNVNYAVKGDYFTVAKIAIETVKQSEGGVERFNNPEEAEEHGAKLLHIISEFRGTEVPCRVSVTRRKRTSGDCRKTDSMSLRVIV
jgi:hypothetical protein